MFFKMLNRPIAKHEETQTVIFLFNKSVIINYRTFAHGMVYWLVAWCSGWRRSLHERSYPTSSRVSTGMGDRLWAGIPSRYVTSQLG